MARVVVITGGSSGIGAAAAARFAREGDVVYSLARRPGSAKGIRHIAADVTEPESLAAAFRTVEAAEGRVDVLVCNAGMGISGAMETTPYAAAERIFAVNFFGVMHTVQAALPLLRKSSRPRILAVSSVAAPIAIPFQSFYSASKAAVNALMEAMAAEVRPFGIRVSLIQPGDTATGFTDARRKNEESPLYAAAAERAVGRMEKDEQSGMSADAVARVIVKTAARRHPPMVRTVGLFYNAMTLLVRLLPKSLVVFIVGKMYG